MTAQTSYLYCFTKVIKFIAYIKKLLFKDSLYIQIIHNLHYVEMFAVYNFMEVTVTLSYRENLILENFPIRAKLEMLCIRTQWHLFKLCCLFCEDNTIIKTSIHSNSPSYL